MSLSASRFEALQKDTRRSRPQPGANCRMQTMRGGVLLSGDVSGLWQHPWQVSCAPAALKSGEIEWRARVHPGFVNGRDAMIGMEVTDPKTNKKQTVQTSLTEATRPCLVLDGWRNPLAPASVAATLDGELRAAPGEGYPPYFQTRGVRAPAKGGNVLLPGATDSPDDPARTREIRALDIVLVVPRVAAVQQLTMLSPIADQQQISISTTFVNDYARHAPAQYRLVTRAKWIPPVQPSRAELLAGSAVEPQTDELRIATVWMVSPPDTAPDAEPDATWTPYPQHAVFWNLMHATRNVLPNVPPKKLELRTFLAVGTADLIIASILSPLNDAYDSVNAYLNAADFSGRFWTV